MLRPRVVGELLRFGIVGVTSNLVLFGAFMAMVSVGVAPGVAMTLLYALGVAQTFVFNRRWTFGHGGAATVSLRRYVMLHLACYSLNLGLLHWLVDGRGLPVAWVQAGAVLLVAALLFVGQKFWVFAAREPSA